MRRGPSRRAPCPAARRQSWSSARWRASNPSCGHSASSSEGARRRACRLSGGDYSSHRKEDDTMANLIRRNPGYEPAQTGGAWDPVRVMRDILRWDPFREVEAVLSPGEVRGFTPTFEVTETKNAYLFRADLPGVKEQD